MDGIHDLGGRQGFGRVPYEPDQEPWHETWEPRAMAVTLAATRVAGTNVDQMRYAIERIPPAEYLTAGYYGRWIRAARTLLEESEVLEGGELPAAQPTGALRAVDRPPRFSTGEMVRVRDLHTAGHTRLPGYCRGRVGRVVLVHPGFVFPDTNSQRAGERPQHVYAVRFEAATLWGEGAESDAAVHVDLFEDYLEAA